MYIDLRVLIIRRVVELQLIFLAKSKGKDHKRNAFQADDTEIRYDCDKRYHGLYMNCVKGILFGL